MKWRFIDLGCVDPAYGPAAFEAIMDSVRRGLSEATILFWTPDAPAVYVGYHQSVDEDIKAKRCAEMNVPIIRRILGGGSGYCDPDQIIYNVIFKEGNSVIPRGPRNVYLHLLPGVIAALHILGIADARIEEERFGVLANGRKISGSGQITSGGVVNVSGSFLVGFDFGSMKQVLKEPTKNLRKGIRDPEEAMTCLRKELGEVTMAQAFAALRKGFEDVLGSSVDGKLTDHETDLCGRLKEKYCSREWTFRADERKKKRGIKP